MKENVVTWLTLLLFAGSVFGQEPPPPPAWDKMIIVDDYQRNHFTFAYQSAVLRRSLEILEFKFASVLVQPITIGHDGWIEPVLKQPFRALPGAWNAWIVKGEDKLDGHFAAVARITFPEGYTISCVSTLTRRKVDPYFLWVRLTPCWPDFGTQAAWSKAAELDLEGFVDLDTLTFERTPHVNIGPDSLKSRRSKR